MAGATGRPTAIWLGTRSLADTGSGAAQSVRAILATLAEHGWDVHAIAPTVVEHDTATPVSALVGNQAATEAQGHLIVQDDGVIRQHSYVTAHTGAAAMDDRQCRQFLGQAKTLVAQLQPDIAITWGQSSLWQALVQEARPSVGHFLYYLGNPYYEAIPLRELMSGFLANSAFTQAHYRDRLGLASRVVPPIVAGSHLVAPDDVLAVRQPAERAAGFVTMINPSAPKGVTLFARLAAMARRQAPGLTFLAVEGRVTRAQLAESGLDFSDAANVWWLSNQRDIRRVYARTSVVLMPSFWLEAAGRVAIEAQLAGLPVLASDRGGLGETLNGGGFLFPVPEACQQRHMAMPAAAEVQPWLDKLIDLMGDEAAYRDASRRALEAGRPLHPERVKADLVAYCNSLAR